MLKTKITKLILIATITSTLTNIIPAYATPSPGWHKDPYNKWFYINEDSTFAVNQWKQIDGKWYYFGGVQMVTGYRPIGDDRSKPYYHFEENGVWDGKGPYSQEEVNKLYEYKKEIEPSITYSKRMERTKVFNEKSANEINTMSLEERKQYNDDLINYGGREVNPSETSLILEGIVENQVADMNNESGHSINDIVNKWTKLRPKLECNVKLELNKNLFIEEPSVVSPYKIGKVDDKYLEDSLNYLNFIRYISYLNPVQLDSNLTTQAQYGAVLTAANKKLEHTNPLHPIGMSDEFYRIGQKSTSSSNLSGGPLFNSMQSYVDDTSNLMGIDNIGHREWILDSRINKVGLGAASNYSVLNLPFDELTTDIKSQNYITWPSEGAFPNTFINRSALWSINLNRNVYDLTNIDDISIKVTRLCDSKQWNLQKVNSFSKPVSGFRLSANDNSGYGSSTLIFHITNKDLQIVNYLGKYKVEINGLKNINGDDEGIEYTINFFNLNDISKNNN